MFYPTFNSKYDYWFIYIIFFGLPDNKLLHALQVIEKKTEFELVKKGYILWDLLGNYTKNRQRSVFLLLINEIHSLPRITGTALFWEGFRVRQNCVILETDILWRIAKIDPKEVPKEWWDLNCPYIWHMHLIEKNVVR